MNFPLDAIASEYPVINTWNVHLARRFEAGPGRLSDSYLLTAESHKPFVAKYGPPTATSSRGVLAEWHALRLTAESSVPVPALLFPDHQPYDFILMDLVDGSDASSESPSAETVGLIGDALSQLHEVAVPRFGDLAYPQSSWIEMCTSRIAPKLAALADVLEPDVLSALGAKITELLPILADEPSTPILIHRDVYLSNFIIAPDRTHAAIIDFGMACGGCPLYDLAKFFILDLYRSPNLSDAFLTRYFAKTAKPPSYAYLIRLYLYIELLGMIRYFHEVGQESALRHATTVLIELLTGQGTINDLIG